MRHYVDFFGDPVINGSFYLSIQGEGTYSRPVFVYVISLRDTYIDAKMLDGSSVETSKLKISRNFVPINITNYSKQVNVCKFLNDPYFLYEKIKML